jgi:hypothetical protein
MAHESDPEVFWIKTSAVTGEGFHCDIDWKAWRHTDQVAWWELRRVSDTLQLISGRTYLDRWLRDHVPVYIVWWEMFGITAKEAMLPSKKSFLTRARMARLEVLDEGLDAHDVPTISTRGLLVLLFASAMSLKSKDVKGRAEAAFRAALCKLVEPGFATGLLEAGMPAGLAANCGASQGGQPCCHYEQCAQAVATWQAQPALAELLWGLVVAAGRCGACRAHAGELIAQLARHICGRLPESSYTSDALEAGRLDDSSRARKRPIDEDFKRAVSFRAVQEGRASSGPQYLKATAACSAKNGARWADQELLWHQAAGWLGASSVESVTVALDAKRLGNPAENVEVMGAWVSSDQGQFMSWLPPQVSPLPPLSHTHTWQT